MNIARIADQRAQLRVHGRGPVPGRPDGAVARSAASRATPCSRTVKHYALNNQETDRMTRLVATSTSARCTRSTCRRSRRRSSRATSARSCAPTTASTAPTPARTTTLLDGNLRRELGLRRLRDVRLGRHALDRRVGERRPRHGDARHAGAVLRRRAQDGGPDGKVPQARLDDMVRRIFVPMFRFGLFDHPPAPSRRRLRGQRRDARRTARSRARSPRRRTVLLKNDDDVLPLDQAPARRSRVIGYAANPVGAQHVYGGGGSSHGRRSALPRRRSARSRASSSRRAAHGDTRRLRRRQLAGRRAAAVASAADVAIVFAADSESEGADRADLTLRPASAPLVCVPARSTRTR